MKLRIALKVVNRMGPNGETRHRGHTMAKAGRIYCGLKSSREASEYFDRIFANIPLIERVAYAVRHNMHGEAMRMLMEAKDEQT